MRPANNKYCRSKSRTRVLPTGVFQFLFERGPVLRLFELFAKASEKKPWLVVLAVAVVTVFMGAGMSRITTELSQESMMPKGYESIEALEVVEDEFGGITYENALIVADDVTSPEIREKIASLPQRLEEEGIGEDRILGVSSYYDVAQKYIDPETEEVKIQELLSNPEDMKELAKMVTMPELDAALVSFQLNPELSQSEQIQLARDLLSFLEDELDIEGVDVYLSGNASMEKDANDFMMKETRILFLAAILFIMLILYLTFRRVSDIFLPLLIIVVAIEWILGFMGWVGIPYTTMSVAIMPLMLGINIAYVIHILSRYYEEREAGKNLFAAATTSIKTVGVAVFLTALTTVIGFASFTITDLPQMRDFGVICLLGIVFSFVLSLTLLPAVVVIRDRRKGTEKLEAHLEKMRKRRREARYGLWIDKSLAGSSVAAYHHYWIVIGCVVAFMIVAGIATFNLKTGADVKSFFPEDMPSRVASAKVTEYFGPQSMDVLLVRGDIYEPANLKALLEVKKIIAGDERNNPGSEDYFNEQRIFSIADFVAGANQGDIPESRQEVEALIGAMKMDPAMKQQVEGMVSADGRLATVMLNSGFPDTEEEIKVKAEVMRDASSRIEQETDLEMIPTGFTVLITDIMGNLLPTQLKTSGLALLLCLLVLIVVFRSFWYGLVTMVVVVFGIAVELIMLWILGWPLDFMTVTISALLIGIGVDFGIHVSHRFREELLHRELSVEDSIKATVIHVGRALVAAAFTTAGVFAILGISSMVPMRRFGWTVAIGLIAALVGAVVVLPSLLAMISGRREKKGKTALRGAEGGEGSIDEADQPAPAPDS